MTKKVYLQSAIIWAVSIGLLGMGSASFLYFAYSNEIGAIEITGKSWTDFCTATEWNQKDVCYAYINFTANNDTFWYPTNYDTYGRSTPYSFDPAVKEWKLERKWGTGWREIPLTKPCTGTWCGGKSGIPAVYSVAWRKGNKYETRISAIKVSPADSIYWSLGNFDPVWLGINFVTIKDCKITAETITRQIEDNKVIFNQNSTFCSDFPVNKSCKQISLRNSTRKFSIGTYIDYVNTTTCEDIGFSFNNKKFYWKNDWKKCVVLSSQIMCEAFHQSNGNGVCESGEGCNYINYDENIIKSTISKTNSIKELKIQ